MRMLSPKTIFICLYYVALSSVAANPLSQRVYLPQPGQTYQNAHEYVIPPEIAIALQQSTSNNCPCSHRAVTQNQIPQPYYDLKQSNFPENSYNIDKVLLDNVLSNPVVSTILNPRNDLYQNGGLYQKQLSSLPQMTNVPNVINNYIIIPSEYSKPNKSLEQGEIFNRKQKGTAKCKNTKVKNRHDDDQCKILNAEDRHIKQRNGNPRINLRQSEDMFDSNINPKNVNSSSSGIKSFKMRCNDKPQEENVEGKTNHILIEGHQSINMLTGDTNENIRTSRFAEIKTGNQTTVNKHVGLNNSQGNNFNNASNDAASGFILNQMQPELDVAKEPAKNKRKPNLRPKNRAMGNAKEEEVVHIMHEKFPNIPEELIRNLISHLKKQFEKNNENFFQKFYSTYQYPLTYDQIFPQLFNFGNSLSTERRQNSEKKRRQRLNKRNQNRRNRNKNNSTKNSTLTATNSPSDRVRINVDGLTDIDSIPIENVTDTPVSEIQEQEFSKQSSKNLKDKEKLLDQRIKMPDIGSEDTVPVFFNNGLVDDYYPDFRAENKANLNSIEEFSASDLRENRYVYTTDKNTGTENLNKENRKSPNKVNGYSNNKKAVSNIFDTEEPIVVFENKNEKVNIIQYRTPLVLENPDFRTKQINKDLETAIERTLVDEAINKISTYSDMKSPTYYPNSKQSNGIQYDERVRKNQSFRSFDNVETVYGNSKVVKYGPTSEHDVEEVTTTKYDKKEKKHNEKSLKSNTGETMIVLAKSLGYW